MQKLKPQFDLFKSHLPSSFKELSLNKSEPSSYTKRMFGEVIHSENVGVKSDFIKTFKVKFNAEETYSIGFSFEFLDKDESEHKVTVSIKIGTKEPMFFTSKELSISEFKDSFIILNNNLLNDKSMKCLNVVELVKNVFDLKPSFKLGKKLSVKM